MRLRALSLIGSLVAFACGSFGDADGTSSSSNGAATGCPGPLPANTACWDFDEGDAPGLETENASRSLDTSTSASPARSLLLTTQAIPPKERAWARLVHPIAKAPKSITLDMRIRIGNQPLTEIGEIELEGPERSYYAVLLAEEGSLKLRDATFIGVAGDLWLEHPLGSVSSTWMHTLMRLDLPQSANEKRKLVVTIDGSAVYDDATEELNFDKLAPSKAFARAGITNIDTYGNAPGTERRMNIDDVIVTWTN